MPHRLIILGASARAAAFSAARAGFEPYAIDLFADCDLAALCPAVRIEKYPRGFLRALAAAPDGPWIYTGGLENHPRLIERLAAMRPLWGNAASALRAVRNPRRLAEVLREEGFEFPRLAPPSQVPALVKPLRSSAGLGIRWATASDFARPPKAAVLQEHIEGESCSATYVAAGGRAVLLGATRQLLGRDFGLSAEFLYVGSIGPLDLRDDERAQLARLSDVLARRFNLVGLFGVDFVRTPNELWTIEVNPRYAASAEVLERVTGRHFIELHAAACLTGDLPDPPQPIGVGCAGKAVVYARRNVRWSDDLAHAANTAWPDLADIPQPRQALLTGQPIATVLAKGDSPSAVDEELRTRQSKLLADLENAPNT